MKRIILSIILCLVAVKSESQLQFVPPWGGAGGQLPPSGITWGTATTISGDTDVDTTGTFIWGICWGGTTTTINGVTFTTQSSSVAGEITISGWNSPTGFSSGSNPYNALSTAYKNMLGVSLHTVTSPSSTTVTLLGLTVGVSYRVQYWASESSVGLVLTQTLGGLNNVSMAMNTTGASGGVGQWVIGTFKATAITQSFTVTEGAFSNMFFTGIQLRSNP